MKVLRDYDWPGNIRELSSIVTMGYALCDGELIEPGDFVSQLEKLDDRKEGNDEDLYRRVVVAGEDFWKVIYSSFMDREINRSQVRAMIRRGLARTGGSYRRLLDEFRIPSTGYQKFMDFLRHHRLKP